MAFALTESDLKKLVFSGAHIGNVRINNAMKSYVYQKNPQSCVLKLDQTWNRLVLAARILAGIENPADICVVSSHPHGKFSAFTGATPIAERYTPGTLTNQIQKAFKEPRIIVVTDPAVDHRIVKESSYVGIPVIAFCNSSSPLNYVNFAIPANTMGPKSIGLMWWLLAREVLRFRGTLSRSEEWEVMPDLFMFRNPDEEIEEPEIVEDENKDTTDINTKGVDDADQNANTIQTEQNDNWDDAHKDINWN